MVAVVATVVNALIAAIVIIITLIYLIQVPMTCSSRDSTIRMVETSKAFTVIDAHNAPNLNLIYFSSHGKIDREIRVF